MRNSPIPPPFQTIDNLCLADLKNGAGSRILILFKSAPPSNSAVVAACAYKENPSSKVIETKNLWAAPNSRLGPTVKLLIAQRAFNKKWAGVIPDQKMVSQDGVDLNCHLYCKKPIKLIGYQPIDQSKNNLKCLNQILSIGNYVIDDSAARRNYIDHLNRYNCWWYRMKDNPSEMTRSLWFTPQGILTQGMSKLAHQSTGCGVGTVSRYCAFQCDSGST